LNSKCWSNVGPPEVTIRNSQNHNSRRDKSKFICSTARGYCTFSSFSSVFWQTLFALRTCIIYKLEMICMHFFLHSVCLRFSQEAWNTNCQECEMFVFDFLRYVALKTIDGKQRVRNPVIWSKPANWSKRFSFAGFSVLSRKEKLLGKSSARVFLISGAH